MCSENKEIDFFCKLVCSDLKSLIVNSSPIILTVCQSDQMRIKRTVWKLLVLDWSVCPGSDTKLNLVVRLHYSQVNSDPELL